ncbi:MAG TPA: AzlC family ABC transporter permease [Mycobacteriales bacterium]|nr:AzlC family ABC transporter permease [Mycobacteriales bacterium]
MSADAPRIVVRDAVGVGTAVGTYGVSFGAVAVAAGFSVPQACALSVLAFTGASQFALVGVLGAGGGPVSGVATALLLGSRNALYGLRLASLLRLRGLGERVIGAQLVIDETTAMALARSAGEAARLAFWATGLSIYVVWNLATLLGALGAEALGDPAALGLDAAVPAAFLALLVPQLRDPLSRWTAVAGALVALALVPFAAPGVPVLAAGLVAVAAGGWRR